MKPVQARRQPAVQAAGGVGRAETMPPSPHPHQERPRRCQDGATSCDPASRCHDLRVWDGSDQGGLVGVATPSPLTL